MSDQNESKPLRDPGEVLDNVLARYAGEPLTGFEERIVRRVRQRQLVQPNRLGWPRWTMNPIAAIASVAAIAAVSAAIGVRIGEQHANTIWQRRTDEMKMSAAVKKSVPLRANPDVRPASKPQAEARHIVARHQVRGVQQQAARFPTPAPLTAQERALALVASRGGPKSVSPLVLRSATTSESDDKANRDEMHDQN